MTAWQTPGLFTACYGSSNGGGGAAELLPRGVQHLRGGEVPRPGNNPWEVQVP